MVGDFGENPELNAMARRLRELVKKAGGNQRVATIADVPLSTLNTILAGKTDPRLSTLRKLAPALGVSVSALIEDDVEPDNTVNRIYEGDVLIPMRDVWASAGPGADNGDEPIVGHMRFPEAFVRSWGRPTTRVEAIQARGDSMYPNITDGQWVLIDRGDRRLVEGLVYGFRTPDGLRLKRYQKAIDGSPVLASDNRDLYAPERLSPDDIEQLHVAGRVFLTPKMI
jgi:phage repressor protein C with HTH and peptisase S24 domain